MYENTIVLWIMLVATCSAQRGLVVMTTGTKSHVGFFSAIIDALTQDGHKITFVSPYKNDLSPSNVTNILLEDDYQDRLVSNAFESNVLSMASTFPQLVPQLCIDALTDDRVKEAMGQRYDYVLLSMYYTECFLPYVYERKVPLMYINPNTMMSPYSMRLGAPEFPAMTQHKLMSFDYPFSFWARAVTAVGGLVMDFSVTKLTEEGTEKRCRELGLWPEETPSVFELQKQASLAFTNSVRALELPIKSVPPTIIYVGGIHIKKTKPLPQDLQKWLDESGEAGFIYFSLGSAVKPSQMKKEHLQSILTVFRGLDQRILWKWDNEDLDLPPNVKISSWLPQLDILAHPKIRLFITHGGRFSVTEATYFSVPVLGMPVFVDQPSVVAEMVSQNWGRRVLWKELTDVTFRNAIWEILTDKTIRQTVDQRSKLMKDWPTTPAEEVLYWVNYVIRYKGAKHLQSPLVHLRWYEIYNVDVWLFFISVVAVIFALTILMIKLCLKFCIKSCYKIKKD